MQGLTLLSYFSDFEYCLYSNNIYVRGIFTSITFETKILEYVPYIKIYIYMGGCVRECTHTPPTHICVYIPASWVSVSSSCFGSAKKKKIKFVDSWYACSILKICLLSIQIIYLRINTKLSKTFSSLRPE